MAYGICRTICHSCPDAHICTYDTALTVPLALVGGGGGSGPLHVHVYTSIEVCEPRVRYSITGGCANQWTTIRVGVGLSGPQSVRMNGP